MNRVISGETLDKEDYYYKMLERIVIDPDWTVLDVGCGPGTLTIPLAGKAAGATALDISSEMLKKLMTNAVRAGLHNIRCLNSSWEEEAAARTLPVHDVVVASRSMITGDMRKALSWMNAVARRAVYVTLPIVHLPLDWEVYRATGRGQERHPPFIYIYNLLYQMGITANVEVLYSRVQVQFSSVEEAVDDLRWRADEFTPEEEQKIRRYFEEKFAEQGGSVFSHEGRSRGRSSGGAPATRRLHNGVRMPPDMVYWSEDRSIMDHFFLDWSVTLKRSGRRVEPPFLPIATGRWRR